MCIPFERVVRTRDLAGMAAFVPSVGSDTALGAKKQVLCSLTACFTLVVCGCGTNSGMGESRAGGTGGAAGRLPAGGPMVGGTMVGVGLGGEGAGMGGGSPAGTGTVGLGGMAGTGGAPAPPGGTGGVGVGGSSAMSGVSGAGLAGNPTAGGGAGTGQAPAPSCERPTKPANVLFVIADDLAFDAIGTYGNPDVRTPNLDRLAARGVSFTHAYTQGAWRSAVCVASRTMFHTGRFLWKAGKLDPQTEIASKRLWSQLMKQAGYSTYMAGKWHVDGYPADQVFDRVMHPRPGMPRTVSAAYNRPVAGQRDAWSPYNTSLGGYWEGGKHWSEVLADDAEVLLRQAKNSASPFFMYLAFNAPHDPRQSPKRYVDMYQPEALTLPRSLLPEYPFKDKIGLMATLRDEKLAPFPRTEYAIRVHRQEYYASITHMDAQIGRILKALEASGRADNTYVVFTSDHGLAVGHHGLMGKQSMFEHDLRAPLIMVGPGLPRGHRVPGSVYLQDAMPTTLEIAQARRPNQIDFRSLFPVACGERAANYDATYGAYVEWQRSVSDGRYKLIYYPAIPKTLLFDLQNDPDEMLNLADDPSQAVRVQDLRALLEKLEAQTGGGKL